MPYPRRMVNLSRLGQRNRSTGRACLLGVWLLSLAACAPELDWREVRPAEAGGLVALFPCKPDASQRRVSLPGVATPLDLHVLSCQKADATWALSFTTVPDVAPALSGLLAALRANLEAATSQSTTAQAPSGRDIGPAAVPHMTPQAAARVWVFRAQRPDGLGRPMDMAVQAWHFSHGLSVFQATVWRSGGEGTVQTGDDQAASFGAGFHFPG